MTSKKQKKELTIVLIIDGSTQSTQQGGSLP